MGGWRLAEEGSNGAGLPAGTVLAPGETIWCTRQATAFEEQFKFKADFETDDTDPTVPEMDGAWPGYANGGGTCLLRDAGGQAVDALVCEEGNTGLAGWSGAAGVLPRLGPGPLFLDGAADRDGSPDGGRGSRPPTGRCAGRIFSSVSFPANHPKGVVTLNS